MRRDQLEHAIHTACRIIQQPEVIVVGSQAILGTHAESQLPAEATMSIEVDILPIAETNDETPGWPISSKAWQESSRPSRSSTGSASTTSTWKPPSSPVARR